MYADTTYSKEEDSSTVEKAPQEEIKIRQELKEDAPDVCINDEFRKS